MKKEFYRHGDLGLVKIDKLPEGLKKADTDILMRGSNNNPHKVSGADVYFKNVDPFVFGYLVASADCKLYHREHGEGKKGLKEADLPEGVYELCRQVEDTHQRMKAVVD
jgi:hypothetical protein